jgi:hypothetical protein
MVSLNPVLYRHPPAVECQGQSEKYDGEEDQQGAPHRFRI